MPEGALLCGTAPAAPAGTGLRNLDRPGDHRQASTLPGTEAARQIGRPGHAEVLQGRRRQAGGIALHAHHDHTQVVAGLWQPGRRPRVEPPFEHVALHVQGAWHQALLGTLRLGADVHEQRARPHRLAGLAWPEPPQPGPGLAEDLLDGAGRAPVAARYHRTAVSMVTRSRPPGPNSKRRMDVSGGE